MLPEPTATKSTPELYDDYGYPLLWLAMLTLAGAVIHAFRYRRRFW